MARATVALICVAESIRDALADHLERRGLDVCATTQTWEAETFLDGDRIDVAVVGDGISPAQGRNLLKRHGREGGPDFVLICRRGDLVDKVLALELGAADVIESPLVVRELAARIGGLLARRGRNRQELLVLENATVITWLT